MEVSPPKRPQRGCTKVPPPPSLITIGLIGNIYTGVKKGEFHITDTFIADLFRTGTRGASPFGSNVLKDLLFGFIGTVRFHTSS